MNARNNPLRAEDFNFGEKHDRAIGFIALFYARATVFHR